MIDIDGKDLPRVEHCEMSFPGFSKHLYTFGEAGTVKIGKDGKVGDWAIIMIRVGYAKHHARDCM